MKLEKKHWIHFSISAFFMAFFFYCLTWFFLFQKMERKLDEFVADAYMDGIIFEQGKPVAGGFPFTPTVRFSGTVNYQGIPVIIPDLKVSSFLIGGTPFSIDMPYGFALGAPFHTDVFSFDKVSVNLVTPSSIPGDLSEADLNAWKYKVGVLKFKSVDIHKGVIKFNADGYIALDGDLQPIASFDTKTRGYQEFIAILQQTGFLHKSEAGLVSVALKGLSQTDPLTGEEVLSLPVTLENQRLFLGPVQVARLPVFAWDRHRSPGQPQRQHDGLRAFQRKFDKDTPRPLYE